tara:strand:- start:1026 stop:1193 length:168 start_codon:yes stop_codon:yes gene_type:complete
MNEYLVELFYEQFDGYISINVIADNEEEARSQAYDLAHKAFIESSIKLLSKSVAI